MNKKVFIAMLILTISFLVSFYVLKIFFPQEFVMAVENEHLIIIGNYIDTHKWSYYLFGIFTSFITYWLYCCAVCRKLFLNLKECVIILIVIGLSIALSFYDVSLSSELSIIAMLLLPLIFKGDMHYMPIVMTVNNLSQLLTLKIRNLPIYLTTINSLNIFILSIDMFFWLILLYIIGNYKIKEK